MRNRKRILWATGAVLLFSAVSISAYSEASVMFRAASGKVKVHLEEYRKENGKEVPWQDGQVVMPGQILSKIPRIKNDGKDCYVRAAVEFESEKESEKPLTQEQLVGISRDWVKSGEYYYYKEILPSDASVDLFQGIRIPEEWESGVDDGNQWSAEVTVDAVQAENLKPDFSSPDPWKMETEGYEIQDAPDRDPSEQEGNQEPVIFEIEQDMKGFSVDSQEFFRDLETFMPGEAQVGVLEFNNRSEQERTVYMKSEILEESEFLEKLELVIQIREEDSIKIIYQGDLRGENMQEYQKLGAVPAKGQEKVEFVIRLPKEADNRFAARLGKAKFWFTTDIPAEEAAVNPPKTGDPVQKWMLPGIILPLPFLAAAAFRVWKKRRKERPKW